MNYTTYLFDFDYTLADSSRGIVTCFRNVLTRHGYMEVTDEEIKQTIGRTLQDSFSILTGVTDEQQLEDFRKEYGKEADMHMTVNTVFFLETKSVLVALKDAGARIGIISTKYRFRINELLDHHFPAGFMNIIIGGEDVKAHKPSPEGLLFAIKQLNVTKAETLYIGDSTIDAETAQAAGVDFAGITHGVTTAKELSKYPHRKIMSSLEELLNSDEGNPTQPDSESPLLPDDHSPAPKRKKRITPGQIALLVLLLCLSYYELSNIGTWLFPLLFILTLWSISQKRSLLPDKLQARIAPWWKPYSIRLRALHIRLIRGKRPPAASNEPCTCRNCGTTYTGNFCARCGQSSHTPRYRLGNALKNILGGFTNIDNGFGRTLLDLLHRPGYLIRDFIGGKRIPYFRPFQTLFILAALYIVAVQLVDPDALRRQESSQLKSDKDSLTVAHNYLQKQMSQAGTEEEKSTFALAIKSLEQAQRQAAANDSAHLKTDFRHESQSEGFVDDLVTGWIGAMKAKDGLEKKIQQSSFLTRVQSLLQNWGHGNKAISIIAMLPFFALATRAAFFRRKQRLTYNLTEHVFIQAYIACQILLLSIIVLPFNGSAQVDDFYEMPWWCIFLLFCWDYKQLYHCTWWKSFWRTILMFFYCALLVVLFAILITGLAVAGLYLLKPILT